MQKPTLNQFSRILQSKSQSVASLSSGFMEYQQILNERGFIITDDDLSKVANLAIKGGAAMDSLNSN